jgi:hypothetical protein
VSAPAVSAPRLALGPQAAIVDAVASIRDIGWLCSCRWNSPDYSRPSYQRRWTLTSPDPECRVQRHSGTGAAR